MTLYFYAAIALMLAWAALPLITTAQDWLHQRS